MIVCVSNCVQYTERANQDHADHKCSTESDYYAMLSAGIVVQVLDIVSDLMSKFISTSIPIVLSLTDHLSYQHSTDPTAHVPDTL